jgi:hypothetical protein
MFMKHSIQSRLTAFALLVVIALAVVSGSTGTGRAQASPPPVQRFPNPICLHVHVACSTLPSRRVK